jgi:hypothetical protein
MERFAFLLSTRFYALLIGGIALVAQGDFTQDAWVKGIIFVVSGFVAVRTIDRNTGDTK